MKNKMMKKMPNIKGFTMIEIIVAVGAFSVTMIIVMSIFQSVIEGQRSSIAAQNTQESMRFAFEVISKEVRMAKLDDPDCGFSGNNLVYNTSSGNGVLHFTNKEGYCVSYFLEADGNVSRLKIVRDHPDTNVLYEGYITPDEVDVSNLNFTVDDNTSLPKRKQPKITMKMDVEAIGQAIHNNNITMQTTISSRSYAD